MSGSSAPSLRDPQAPSRPRLTALVLTHNVEDVVRGCLESVRFADEVLVVDSFSTDATLEIARSLADRVLQHEYGNYALQNNWAIPQAAHEWVLLVDSDEQVTPELRDEVLAVLAAGPRHAGYFVRRRNHFMGQRVRYCWKSDKCLRLFRRDEARFPAKEVHANASVRGTVGRLRGELLHFTCRSFEQYMSGSFLPFTTRAANDLARTTPRVTAWHLLGHPAGRFFKQYVLKRGFLDGRTGLVVCGLSAFSAFLKYAKLWERREREAAERRGKERGS